MKLKYILFFAIGGAVSACTTQKEQIYWVHSMKMPCNVESEKTECLQVSKNEDLNKAEWELLHNPIENFTFEEGFFKKIQVQETQLNSENTSANTPSIRYTMIKEIEKQKDMTFDLARNWVLEKLNGNAVTQSLKPNLNIHLQEKKINGIGGCNNYFGAITQLSQNEIQFDNIGATRKMCMEDNVEALYFKTLSEVRKFKINEEKLILFDASGKETLVFSSKPLVDTRLQDVWKAVRIDGKAIKKKTDIPLLRINLTEMSINGNDSCNDYFADIEELNEEKITFGDIATTAKLCSEMETAHRYNEAIGKVASYKLDNAYLLLYDVEGNEVLAFTKGD